MGPAVDIAAIFGDNLVRARRAADISQDELGRLCDVHRTEISQLERGLRIPRLDTFAKICSTLDVDPVELMAGIVWKPPRLQYGSFKSPSETSE